jgi:hypothetical protein
VVPPSYEEVVADQEAFARMSRDFQRETNPGNGRPLAQRHGNRAGYFNPSALIDLSKQTEARGRQDRRAR